MACLNFTQRSRVHRIGFCFLIFACLSTSAFSQDQSKRLSQIAWNEGTLKIGVSTEQVMALRKLADGDAIDELIQIGLKSNDFVQILGRTRFESQPSQFWFQPRFPIDPGKVLSIRLGKSGQWIAEAEFKVPGSQLKQAPRVTKIFPSGNSLPANILKFYIHFATPMQRGNIYRHFSIVETDTNQKVELPFLELEQELWSRNGLRLTLFFDPGRIKRGLKPREDLGAIFQPGKNYQFRISGKWKDERGKPLGKDVVKRFGVIDEDNKTPDVKNWKLSKPLAGTRQALTVEFDEPLDSALVTRVISLGLDGKEFSIDQFSLSQHEKTAKIVPLSSWPTGSFELRVGAELEDLCGNRIGKPFDVDLDQKRREDKRSIFEIKFDLK